MAQTVRHNPIIAEPAEESLLTGRQVALALAALFLLNLLLRVFYLRYDFVTGDEAIRAITATRLLEGARLYADIVTDKPPGTTFFYAAVFRLFGRSMIAIHLAAAMWNFGTSVVLYFTAARFYDRRTGIWAALLFVYFSTNYYTQDMMAANTELLMVLPYAASFYFFVRARRAVRGGGVKITSGRSTAALLIAGLFTGLAALFKQVAVFNLFFFAFYEGIAAYRASREDSNARVALKEAGAAFVRLLAAGAGFAAVMVLLYLWLRSTSALADFWRSVFEIGSLYVRALPRDVWLKFMAGRTLGYVLFNLALWLLAGSTIVQAIRSKPAGEGTAKGGTGCSAREMDLMVSLWGCVSLVAAFTGGRFFGHYFIQVLPALSLLGARGVSILREGVGGAGSRRRVVVVVLILLFTVGLVRFHGRTAILAYETLTGTRTATSESWGMTQREREAEVVANRLRGMAAEGEPVFIWGYALDVYWRSGCRPASRYLMPYYTTGRFLDGAAAEPENEGFWREASSRLIEDLRQERPRVVLDVEDNLISRPNSELSEFVQENYRRDGQVGPDPNRPFVVYRLKE